MKLIEEILNEENLKEAIHRVKINKGTSGVDKMPVNQIETYFYEHKDEIIELIMNKDYKPQPVRRVYIPKANGKCAVCGDHPTITELIDYEQAECDGK